MGTRFTYVGSMLLLAFMFFIQGCGDDNNDQELYEKEMRLLEQYLVDNDITQEPTSSGLYYIEIEEGTGMQPAAQFIVDFEYTVELIDGTVIGTTDDSLAREWNIYSENILYGPIRQLINFIAVPGVNEGLQLMKEGGKARLIVPSPINGLGGEGTALSPARSTHIYTINLIHAFNDPERFQTNQIILYLQEEGVDSVYVTDSGLHYILQAEGTGEGIKNGDIVEVWYSGYFLDGRQFDSNRDRQIMIVSMPAEGYIPAWDEALKLMKEGEHARFIVPYDLAYGSTGSSGIPPYMPLVFDIEVEKVTR